MVSGNNFINLTNLTSKLKNQRSLVNGEILIIHFTTLAEMKTNPGVNFFSAASVCAHLPSSRPHFLQIACLEPNGVSDVIINDSAS